MTRPVLTLLILALCASSCRPRQDVLNLPSGNSGTPVGSGPVDTRFEDRFFQAMSFRDRGEWQKSAQAFEECIALNPAASAASHYELSRILRMQKSDPNAALPHARSAALADPQNPWYHHELGEVYLAQGKFDLAARAFHEVERLNPYDPNSLYDQATALMYGGKLKEAIVIYDRIEKTTGVYEELSLEKHQIYLELEDSEKAGLELEHLARAYPEEPRYWGDVLRFYMQAGMQEKAAHALDRLTQSDPGNGAVHFQLSEYYAATGDNLRSWEELKKAFGTTDIGIDQKIGILLRYYSLTEFDPTWLPQAYELLDLTESQHPSEAKAYSIYGDFLYREGKDEEALHKFQKAAQLDPSKSQIWTQIILIEAQRGQFEDLEKDSREAMLKFPTLPEYYLYHGIACEQLGKYPQAIDALRTGKELVVDDPVLSVQFLTSLGGIYHETGQHDASDAAYEEALLIDPDNALVLNNYAYFLALRKTKLDRALELIRHCNTLDPDNASFADTFAWVWYQRGEYALALEWIEKAYALGGNTSGEVLEHYGDILFRLGRESEAREKWLAAKARGESPDRLEKKINGGQPD